MSFKISRCFFILWLALNPIFACGGGSESKQASNTDINTNHEHNTNADTNTNTQKPSEFKFEKLTDLSGFYANQICDMQVDPEHKESVLVWVKTKNTNDDEHVDRLALWNRETQFSLEKFEQSSNPIVALSSFRNGKLHKVSLKPVSENVSYFKGHYFLNILDIQTLNESVSPIQFINVDPDTDIHAYLHRYSSGSFPVKLKNLTDGNLAALVRTKNNLKLLNYDTSGKLKWSRVLQSKSLMVAPPWMDSSEISVNSKDEIAVVFDLPDEQIEEFEKAYQVSLNRGNQGSEEILVVFDKHGQFLRVQDLQDLGSVKLTWVYKERVALISSKRTNGQDKVQVIMISKIPEDNTIVIPIDVQSKLFFVRSIHAVNERRVLITGSVDYQQTDTSSVMAPGKAFVGVYDLEERKFIFMQRVASERDNRVTAVSEESPGVFLIAMNDGPLTHDEDRITKSSIYRLSQ